jgi:hypothetical protein
VSDGWGQGDRTRGGRCGVMHPEASEKNWGSPNPKSAGQQPCLALESMTA